LEFWATGSLRSLAQYLVVGISCLPSRKRDDIVKAVLDSAYAKSIGGRDQFPDDLLSAFNRDRDLRTVLKGEVPVYPGSDSHPKWGPNFRLSSFALRAPSPSDFDAKLQQLLNRLQFQTRKDLVYLPQRPEKIGLLDRSKLLGCSSSILDRLMTELEWSESPSSIKSDFLEWFFEPTNCLLVRQLYSMLEVLVKDGCQSASWRNEKQVFGTLLDIWDDGDESTSHDLDSLSTHILAEFYAKLSATFPDDDSSDISENRLHDAIRSSIWLAVKDTNTDVEGALLSLNRWIHDGGKFQAMADSPPQIDRCLWALAMFGSEKVLDDFNEDERRRLMSFLKAIPFSSFTRFLPAIAELAIALRTKFALQLNLIYVLLRTCSKCGDVLGFCADCFDSISRPRIESALLAVDRLYPNGDVYEKLNSFVRRAVEIHNSILLSTGEIETVPFRCIQENFMMPYARLENTILPVMVHTWSLPCGGNWSLFVDAIRYLQNPSDGSIESNPVIFVDDLSTNVYFRKILFDPSWDFVGFTQDDFRRSLSKFWEAPRTAELREVPGTEDRFACRRALMPDLPATLPPRLIPVPRWAIMQILFDEREQNVEIVIAWILAGSESNAELNQFTPVTLKDQLNRFIEFKSKNDMGPIERLGTAAKDPHAFLVNLKRDVEQAAP
jgi:hypothetical protein